MADGGFGLTGRTDPGAPLPAGPLIDCVDHPPPPPPPPIGSPLPPPPPDPAYAYDHLYADEPPPGQQPYDGQQPYEPPHEPPPEKPEGSHVAKTARPVHRHPRAPRSPRGSLRDSQGGPLVPEFIGLDTQPAPSPHRAATQPGHQPATASTPTAELAVELPDWLARPLGLEGGGATGVELTRLVDIGSGAAVVLMLLLATRALAACCSPCLTRRGAPSETAKPLRERYRRVAARDGPTDEDDSEVDEAHDHDASSSVLFPVLPYDEVRHLTRGAAFNAGHGAAGRRFSSGIGME